MALRLTNLKTGQYYSRYWKTRLIPESEMFNDGTYIYIHGSAFGDVFVELFALMMRRKGRTVQIAMAIPTRGRQVISPFTAAA